MKKRILSLLLALTLALTLLPAVVLAEDAAITPDYSWYTDGATEFTIATPAQLLGFANIVNGLDGKTKDTFRNKKVTLSDDINLATIENWTPIGRLDASDNFEGEFDGNGKTISNMKITFATGRVRAGLFASPESALIHDLTLKNFTIKAKENTTNGNVRAGALAANIWRNTVVKNITVDGFIFSARGYDVTAGGLAGVCGNNTNKNPTSEEAGLVADVVVKNVNINISGRANVGGVFGLIGPAATSILWDTVIHGSFQRISADGIEITLDSKHDGFTALGSNRSSVGGFVGGSTDNGVSQYADFIDCTVTNLQIELLGDKPVSAGGFTGRAKFSSWKNERTYKNCSTQGEIRNNVVLTDKDAEDNGYTKENRLGGFMGESMTPVFSLEDVNADVDIVSRAEDDSTVAGGFLGVQSFAGGNIAEDYRNCTASGDVSGTIAGGFIGRVLYANLESCKASGKVTGATTGGLIGELYVPSGSVWKQDYNVILEDCTAADLADEIIGKLEIKSTKPLERVLQNRVSYTGEDHKQRINGYTVSYVQNGVAVIPRAAGTYDVILTPNGEGENIKIIGGLVIKAASLTIKADDKEMKANAEFPKFTYTLIGIAPEDTVTKEPSFVCVDEKGNSVDGKTPGTYRIIPSDAEVSGDYEISYQEGKLTVGEAEPENDDYMQWLPAFLGSNPFHDVSGGAYYNEAVRWAVKNGIASGTDAKHFSPDAACTRGQAVTFLWRTAGCPAPAPAKNPFVDVKPTDYCYDAVLWAVQTGVAKGTSASTFSPDAACTRGQIVTFLYRAAGSPSGYGNSGYTDVPETSYCAAPVAWAVALRVTSGTSAITFSPDALCTRAQIVTFLYRANA